MSDTVYIITVNLPGCLPEQEPYAVRGEDMAYDCARNELEDCDSLGCSRAEWASALEAGGASVYMASGYVLEVAPLDALGLPEDEVSAYMEDVA